MTTLFDQLREEGEIKGLLEGIQIALEIKFGNEGLSLFQRVKNVSSLEKLHEIKSVLRKADSLTQVESLL